ncbi:transmembrane protein, putative (macronuclear) [Tetrahymena thermophila SB210]|uniref:Transmembrane protein, putative n=1 Tax=Tetrahymena thermophila (strain SB210) TaxID=312017 RepID=Q23UA6_TETTS|nr:transmembrane protein, putative [Tetrahymena thermophila SB210]EAS00159.1 transmembrane protein, putative [Tetrahymena thermophila SB210]|eukprot:XP_001020404.1 transmembrane protein, putative [Tetrahymena thermophila SB210]
MSLGQTNQILFTIKEDEGENISLIQLQNKNDSNSQSSQPFSEIDQTINDLQCCQSQGNLLIQDDDAYCQQMKVDKSAQTSDQLHKLTSSASIITTKKISPNQDPKKQTQICIADNSRVSLNIFTQVFNKIKQYTKNCIDLFMWERKYSSFGKYSFQFLFDGISIYFLNKKAQEFKSQLNECKKEEEIVKKNSEEINKDTQSLFIKSQIGENVLVKGKIINQLAIERINNIHINDQEQKKMSSFTIYGYSFSNLPAQFDQNLCFNQQDLPLNQPYKINLLAKLAATALSRYIYKSKLSLENGSFDSQIFYYFYGKKDFLTNGQLGLKISSIFKEFNFLQFKIDQKALILSILITYGISIYFAFKFVKNVFAIPKKIPQGTAFFKVTYTNYNKLYYISKISVKRLEMKKAVPQDNIQIIALINQPTMENKSQSNSEIEDKKNLNLQREAKYTLLNDVSNIDEEQKLLQSLNNPTLCQDNLSKASSQCDQSIELIASNLLDSKVTNQENQQNIQSQQLQSVNKYDSSEIVDTVKEYVNSFVDLFKWNREYDSFYQLYFQIGFDSLLAFYFYKNQKKLNKQRDNLKQEQKIVNDMAQRLQNDPLCLFHGSKLRENTLILIGNSESQKIEKNKRNQIFTLRTQNGYLDAEVDKDFKYLDNAFFFEAAKDMGLLTKLTASTISFVSGKLFKFKISFHTNKELITYYLFGKKDRLSDGSIGLCIKQQIQDLNLSHYQVAYLISILVASGFCLYFSAKIAKNIIYLAKKKKLFRKKK